jgi:hypothetical protein
MPKANQKTEIFQRLTRVETKVDELQKAFDDFKGNDFKHLQDEVDKIIFVVIIGTLISIVVSFIK